MDLWVNEFWLLFTAILFTIVGYWFGKKSGLSELVEIIIDSLIEQGYVKVKGFGSETELIPWKDWCDDKSSGKDS